MEGIGEIIVWIFFIIVAVVSALGKSIQTYIEKRRIEEARRLRRQGTPGSEAEPAPNPAKPAYMRDIVVLRPDPPSVRPPEPPPVVLAPEPLDEKRSPVVLKSPPQGKKTLRLHFSRTELKKAVVLSEILGPPLALRESLTGGYSDPLV